jgi:hypothetical protein
VDRILRIPRVAADMAVKMYQYDIDPSIGADNMRFLAGIRNDDTRANAEHALIKGKSPDMVKIAVRSKDDGGEDDSQIRLTKEKQRLERTIESLKKRLDQVNRELATV